MGDSPERLVGKIYSPVFARKIAKNLGKRYVFRGFCRGQHFYPRNMVDGGGFEPPKAELADLQSAPFGHSGTRPYMSCTGAGDGT